MIDYSTTPKLSDAMLMELLVVVRHDMTYRCVNIWMILGNKHDEDAKCVNFSP